MGDVAIGSVVPPSLLDTNPVPTIPIAVTLRRAQTRRTVQLTRSTTTLLPRDGNLGLTFGATPPSAGVAITEVRAGSPADKAGLRVGDRLLKMGSTVMNSRERATRAMSGANAADSVSFAVFQRDSVTRGVLVRR